MLTSIPLCGHTLSPLTSGGTSVLFPALLLLLLLSCWVMSNSVTPWTAACQASPSLTVSRSLLKEMPSNHLTLCCPLLLPSVFQPSGSFPVSWLFTSSDQSTGVSASASVRPMNIQGWLSLGLTGIISLQSKGFSSLFQHHNLKASILCPQPSLWFNSHICTWLVEKS